jgi:hypothetical protein
VVRVAEERQRAIDVVGVDGQKRDWFHTGTKRPELEGLRWQHQIEHGRRRPVVGGKLATQPQPIEHPCRSPASDRGGLAQGAPADRQSCGQKGEAVARQPKHRRGLFEPITARRIG